MSQIRFESDVAMAMRDGAVLRANVFRPDDGRPHPVLLHRTPYSKEGGRSGDLIDPIRAAQAGYASVVQDVRGRWSSDGDQLSPFVHEFHDGHDSVGWCATQPWSSGAVVCHGLSYGGFTSWAAATERPAGLTAVIAAQTPARFFGDLFYRGGALNWALLAGWTFGAGPLVDVIQSALAGHLDPATAGLAVAELVDASDNYESLLRHLPLESFPAFRPSEPDFAPFFFEVLAHDTDDDYARARSLAHRLADTAVPSFVVAGWHDLYVGSDLDGFRALQEHPDPRVRHDSRLVVGPWSHANFQPVIGDVDFGLRSTGGFLDLAGDLTGLLLGWLDRTIGATAKAAVAQAPVRIFVQGVDRWRDEQTWPLDRAVDTTFYLGPDGTLPRVAPPVGTPPCHYTYDPQDPCPTVGGALLPMRLLRAGPLDQSAILTRPDVLVFTTEPFDADLEVTGPVRSVLHAATSESDTDWVVKLCDVHPDGRTFGVTDGVLRARYQEGGPGPAGAVVAYRIDLLPTSMVFRAGHCLRVLVTSSDFPRYDRNLNTGVSGVHSAVSRVASQQVFLDGVRASHLILPVVTT